MKRPPLLFPPPHLFLVSPLSLNTQKFALLTIVVVGPAIPCDYCSLTAMASPQPHLPTPAEPSSPFLTCAAGQSRAWKRARRWTMLGRAPAPKRSP